MKTPNELHADIQKQLTIGFTKNDVANNLLLKGHDKEDIKDAFNSLNFGHTATANDTGTASATSIWLGILFIVLIIILLTTSTPSTSFILALGIFTVLGMALYYFTKKR